MRKNSNSRKKKEWCKWGRKSTWKKEWENSREREKGGEEEKEAKKEVEFIWKMLSTLQWVY